GELEPLRTALQKLVGIDPAVAEIADQELVAVPPEVTRRQGDGPWGVERPPRRDSPEQVAAGVEDVDEAAAPARDVVVLFGVLLGIGDEQEILRGARGSDARDPERGVSFRYPRIGECPRGE